MHLVTFLITAFESVMLFFAIIWYQSRPSEKARGRYVILLILLIQYNVYSGLFPDVHINIPIQIQLILAYFGGISVSMYFIYYVYKALELQRLKTIAVYGSIWCLFLPFIIFFIIPYLITGDADFSRKLVVIIPFAFTVFYVYTLTKSVWPKIRHLPSGIERQETLGLYISVLLWATLPVIVYFDGSQVVENGITNMGFMIMSVVFVRSAIFKSREDFAKLQESKEQLVQANETLLTKVKERTQELEIANQKRLNSFINLMHETKTPLTLINNCLDDLMQKYGASEETDITKLNLVKLNRNMNNFFDVHKLDRGIHIYDHSINIDFSEMIKNAIREFSPLGKRKGIIISSDIDEDILLKADPEAIYRVVDNLMENAIKYSNPDGQIYVQLKKDREFINLTIKDNGSGIAEEHQQKIFSPIIRLITRKEMFRGWEWALL